MLVDLAIVVVAASVLLTVRRVATKELKKLLDEGKGRSPNPDEQAQWERTVEDPLHGEAR